MLQADLSSRSWAAVLKQSQARWSIAVSPGLRVLRRVVVAVQAAAGPPPPGPIAQVELVAQAPVLGGLSAVQVLSAAVDLVTVVRCFLGLSSALARKRRLPQAA